jgi:hypothetical protein
MTGGYVEKQLESDVFLVGFGGNAYVSREKARDFAMLRASELTLGHGFKCFAIMEEQTYIVRGEGGIIHKPAVEVKIRCYPEQPANPETLDASFLEHSLKDKYKLK